MMEEKDMALIFTGLIILAETGLRLGAGPYFLAVYLFLLLYPIIKNSEVARIFLLVSFIRMTYFLTPALRIFEYYHVLVVQTVLFLFITAYINGRFRGVGLKKENLVPGISLSLLLVVAIWIFKPHIGLYFMPAFLVKSLNEEMLFRGIQQGSLQNLSPALALGVSSLNFALLHDLGGGLLTVAVLAVLGLFIGLIYQKTGNLAGPVMANIAFSTMGV